MRFVCVGWCFLNRRVGKERMRQFVEVDIPQEAFISALKMDR